LRSIYRTIYKQTRVCKITTVFLFQLLQFDYEVWEIIFYFTTCFSFLTFVLYWFQLNGQPLHINDNIKYIVWELRFYFTEMRINTSKVCLVKSSFGGLRTPVERAINCTIRLNVCHNELFLPNLWKCWYHVYWNLSYPLSILKVIFSKSHNFD
jgi:hypothetical protein